MQWRVRADSVDGFGALDPRYLGMTILQFSAKTPSVPRRPRGAFLPLVATLALTSPCLAQEDLVDLRWDAPAGCPQARTVQDRIRSIVGQAAKTSAHLQAEGRIAREERRYRLTLTVYDSGVRRERTIDSDSCADLAGAAAVALGLLLRKKVEHEEARSGDEPSGPARSSEPAAIPTEPKPRESASGTAKPDNPSPPDSEVTDPSTGSDAADADASERSLHVLLRAPLVAVDVGQLPTSEASFGAGIGIRYGSWHGALLGRMYKGQTLWASSFPGVGAEVDHAGVELWNCRLWTAGRFEFAPCLTLALDRYTARGTGPEVTAQTQNFLVFTPGAAVMVHLRIFDWMAPLVWAGAGVETSRPRIDIAGIGEIRQLGPARAGFGLGSEWIF